MRCPHVTVTRSLVFLQWELPALFKDVTHPALPASLPCRNMAVSASRTGRRKQGDLRRPHPHLSLAADVGRFDWSRLR